STNEIRRSTRRACAPSSKTRATRLRSRATASSSRRTTRGRPPRRACAVSTPTSPLESSSAARHRTPDSQHCEDRTVNDASTDARPPATPDELRALEALIENWLERERNDNPVLA